jgi:hypothetical protein
VKKYLPKANLSGEERAYVDDQLSDLEEEVRTLRTDQPLFHFAGFIFFGAFSRTARASRSDLSGR